MNLSRVCSALLDIALESHQVDADLNAFNAPGEAYTDVAHAFDARVAAVLRAAGVTAAELEATIIARTSPRWMACGPLACIVGQAVEHEDHVTDAKLARSMRSVLPARVRCTCDDGACMLCDDDGMLPADPDACPGCGCKPGDGITDGCTHPAGCGEARAQAVAS
jgi:hypothetical protein